MNGNIHRNIANVYHHDGSPNIGNAADLQRRVFPEIRYIVPGLLARGLTLFAGKPKIGKSWFCLELALSVAGGRYCLSDLKCDEGDVLFIGLEDNERRLQKRIAKLLPRVEWPSRFHYVLTAAEIMDPHRPRSQSRFLACRWGYRSWSEISSRMSMSSPGDLGG